MNDPVWFGNYIIARWEAFAILGIGGIVTIAMVVVLFSGIFWLFKKLAEKLL